MFISHTVRQREKDGGRERTTDMSPGGIKGERREKELDRDGHFFQFIQKDIGQDKLEAHYVLYVYTQTFNCNQGGMPG